MSCCPPSSWPQLKTEYKPQGNVTSLGDIDVYSVGTTPNKKCIIWNYDIFGFDSGRTRQLCDLFANEGYFVVMPDYFRGTWLDPFAPGADIVGFIDRTSKWAALEADLKNKILPFCKQNGAEIYGTMGTCWGSTPVVKMCAWDGFKCGVSMHPSHSMLFPMIGEDEKASLEAVKCPQLFMPAGNDGPQCKAGGIAEEILKDVTICEFPDMEHGWTTRGDMSDANTNRDVTKAVSEAIGFFKKHV